jgi:hypothetical protein
LASQGLTPHGRVAGRTVGAWGSSRPTSWAPPGCAGRLPPPRRRSPCRTRQFEATRHTRARPGRDTAAMRQFSHWRCRTLSSTRSLAGLGRHPPGPTRISRQLLFRHRATTAADVALSHRLEASVVVIDFCLFFLPSATPSSNGNTAGAVFIPLAASYRRLSADPDLERGVAKIGQDGGSGQGRRATPRRADAVCGTTGPQERRGQGVDWLRRPRGRWQRCRRQGQRTARPPATGTTRHTIDVIVRARPPTRKA